MSDYEGIIVIKKECLKCDRVLEALSQEISEGKIKVLSFDDNREEANRLLSKFSVTEFPVSLVVTESEEGKKIVGLRSNDSGEVSECNELD